MIDLTTFLMEHSLLFIIVLIIMILGSMVDVAQAIYMLKRLYAKRRRVMYEKVKREILFQQFEAQKKQNERTDLPPLRRDG